MVKILSLEPLARHTTFRIGGPARFFIEVKTVPDLVEAVAYTAMAKLPYLTLGGGSNLLISDAGFDGVVIKVEVEGIEFPEKDLLVVGAGEVWDDVVAAAVSRNLSGIENLSYIPGNAGAAPVQNIGAYGAEIKEVIEWVEVFDPLIMGVRSLTNSECRFGYRDSLFKSEEGKNLIVTRIAMRLRENGKPNISYKDLAVYFTGKEETTIAEVRNAVIEIRKKKLPDVAEVGTAGSFFKNPIVTESKYVELVEKYPDLPSFAAGEGFKKIPLAWVLDKICGLNGYKEGNVGLYKTQPLALVNFGGATANDIKNLAASIEAQVKEKTGIEIEWEVVEVK